MYERFYHLKDKPFRLSPDPRFLYQSRGHSKTLAYLRYGLELGEGFIVVTGEVGTGKTTLIRALMSSLPTDKVVAAQLVTTQLESDELLRMVASAFGLASQDISKAQILRNIETFLTARAREGKRALLIVDEAQNLPARSLEELRMLSNFQLGEKALLQTFLVGQREFQATLQSEGMEQFRQRVIATNHLGPLAADETGQYIEHRLRLVGWDGDPKITDGAYEAIYEITGGVPRNINTLCDRMFLHGCLDEIHVFTEDLVREVAEQKEKEVLKTAEEEQKNEGQKQESVPVRTDTADEAARQAASVGPAPVNLATRTVTDTERRLVALERRVETLEDRIQKLRDRLQKVIMMAMLSDEDVDLGRALESLRKVDEA